MNTQTPTANQPHVAIFGKRNAGKSALLNAIIGQDISLVSSVKGTTTDPVNKTMELIPLGPVLFIDTAGLDDEGILGNLRVQRTLKVLQKTDFALFVMDINDLDSDYYQDAVETFKKYNISYLTVINKIDEVSSRKLLEIKSVFQDALFVIHSGNRYS